MIRMHSQQLFQLFPQKQFIDVEFDFESVVIDSRQSCGGCLFVAIKGENFDGHQFVKIAADQGAVAAIVETPVAGLGLAQIIVEDTRKALAQLANYWRHKVNPLVIAITGSNGKTTVKEMLGRILSGQAKTLMTPGNFNNDIGVPLTLFQLSVDDQFAVIEMGANHRHEISNLVAIAEPDVVYVNNARAAHIEGFGSLQDVIEAKGEMYQYCNASALAVFNEDEDSSDLWKSICASQNRLHFSTRQLSDVTAKSQQLADGLLLSINYQQQQFECRLSVYGAHNVQNALAAITLAIACGIPAQQVCQSLSGFGGVRGRQQLIDGLNGSLIINDSYNANPDSLAAAVDVVCSLQGEPWLALGDMAELGDQSLALHQQAVLDAQQAGIQKLFALGQMSCQAAKVFNENGYCFSHKDAMAEHLASHLTKNINLLVKGSRSAGMEKIVEKLTLNANRPDAPGVNHAV